MKLDLIKMPLDDETALGASHILGCPDVPAKWNDDAVFFNDEVFVGQINLSEVKHPNLPSEGILYFFFASMSKPYRGIVRYAKSLEDLERIDFNIDSPLKANFNVEFGVNFEESTGDVELLGKMPKFKNYKPSNDEVALLKLDFSNYPEVDLFKEYDDVVCYVIKKEDLEKHQFERAFLANNLN